MDQNRLKKICEMALESRGITVTEFRALPTQSYDHEQGKWVPDSYSLFLVLKQIKDCDDNRNVSSFIESVIGFECVVDFD